MLRLFRQWVFGASAWKSGAKSESFSICTISHRNHKELPYAADQRANLSEMCVPTNEAIQLIQSFFLSVQQSGIVSRNGLLVRPQKLCLPTTPRFMLPQQLLRPSRSVAALNASWKRSRRSLGAETHWRSWFGVTLQSAVFARLQGTPPSPFSKHPFFFSQVTWRNETNQMWDTWHTPSTIQTVWRFEFKVQSGSVWSLQLTLALNCKFALNHHSGNVWRPARGSAEGCQVICRLGLNMFSSEKKKTKLICDRETTKAWGLFRRRGGNVLLSCNCFSEVQWVILTLSTIVCC